MTLLWVTFRAARDSRLEVLLRTPSNRCVTIKSHRYVVTIKEDHPELRDHLAVLINGTSGYLDHSAYFEIEMEQKYGAGFHSDTFSARFRIHESTDQATFISGNLTPHLERIEVAREGDGSIQKFRFPISPLSVQNEQGAVLFEEYPRKAQVNYSRVRIRVCTGNLSVPPTKRVRIDTMWEKDVIHSLNTSKWV